jgi:hypothetical protein
MSRRYVPRRRFYTPEAYTYWGTFHASVSQARKQLDSWYITYLRKNNIFGRLDLLYMLAHEDENVARRNMARDAFHLSSPAWPTWTQNRGYQGNGTTQHSRTGYNPSTNRINFSLNNAAMGGYCRTNGNGNVIMGVNQGSNLLQILSPSAATSFSGRINQTGSTSHSSFDTGFLGWLAAARRDAANVYGYKNQTEFSLAIASVAIPSGELFLHCRNSGGAGGLFTTNQMAMYWLGAGFSAAELGVFRVGTETYLDTIGAGVVV